MILGRPMTEEELAARDVERGYRLVFVPRYRTHRPTNSLWRCTGEYVKVPLEDSDA